MVEKFLNTLWFLESMNYSVWCQLYYVLNGLNGRMLDSLFIFITLKLILQSLLCPKRHPGKEFLVIRRAISLNETFVLFC